MNAVIDAAINRYKTTLMVMVMVVVAGLFARNAIPVANEPNIQIPFTSSRSYTRASRRRTRNDSWSCLSKWSCATSRALMS